MDGLFLAAAVLGPFLWIISGFLLIFTIVGGWMLLSKMGKPGWASLIPGLRLWSLGSGASLDRRVPIILAAAIEVPAFIMGLFGAPSPILLVIVEVAYLIGLIYVYYLVAKAFDRGLLYIVLLFLLGGLFMLYMASSRAWLYKGPLAKGETPADLVSAEPSPANDVADGAEQQAAAEGAVQLAEAPVDAADAACLPNGQAVGGAQQVEADDVVLAVETDEAQQAVAAGTVQPEAADEARQATVDGAVQQAVVDDTAQKTAAAGQVEQSAAGDVLPTGGHVPPAERRPQKLPLAAKIAAVVCAVALSGASVIGFAQGANQAAGSSSARPPLQSGVPGSSGNSLVDNSPARPITGDATPVPVDSSIQWAGNDVTGFVQIPSSWRAAKPQAPSSGEIISLNYTGTGSQSLEIKAVKESYAEAVDALAASAVERADLQIDGLDAVRVVTGGGNAGQTTYLVNYGNTASDGSDGYASFKFSYSGEQPAWIDASMAHMSAFVKPGALMLLQTEGIEEIGTSPTQWAGFDTCGYLQVPSSWVRMYYPEAMEKGVDVYRGVFSPEGTDVVVLTVQRMGADWRALESDVRNSVGNPQDLKVEHVTVNGIDGHLATCAFEQNGVHMNLAMCYLDDSGGFWQGTAILLEWSDSVNISADDLLATYVKSK